MGSDQTEACQQPLESDLFMAGDGMEKGCGEGGHINKKPGTLGEQGNQTSKSKGNQP